MRLLIVGLLCAIQLAAADCNHDNCLRDVIATAFTTRSGTADCRSHMVTTIITGAFSPAQTIYPLPGTPTYASDCSPISRYTSACECVGVTPSATTLPATISGYPFLGCYQDGLNRVLNGLPAPYYYIGPFSYMTNEYCAAYCAGKNPSPQNGIPPGAPFKYFGTEFFGYCLCGNSLQYTTTASGSCTATCSGAPNERCGGSGIIDIYGPKPTA